MNNNKEEISFIETFESIFGDFHPSKDDLINIENEDKYMKIDSFMDLIENSVEAFEMEALNIESIYIGNVDTFMKKYKTHFFRTKKSIQIVKEQIKYVKRIKKILKRDMKTLMFEFKRKQRQNRINSIKIKKIV
jgi:hypothetical protein